MFSQGLGGGFKAVMYQKENGKIETITAASRAPRKSHADMFVNATSANGILSLAVPGELKGYGDMHKKFGRVPWKTIIQPSIDLCRNGYNVSTFLDRVLQIKKQCVSNEPSMAADFINPDTNDVWKVGDRITRPKLAETLEIIANEGADDMYTANGTIAQRLIHDIKEFGGIVEIDDLVDYKTTWAPPVVSTLKKDHTLHTIGLPGTGMVLALILNIMSGFETVMSSDFYHTMIESFKYGFAKRSYLGDVSMNASFLNEFTNMSYANEIRSRIKLDQTFNDFNHYGAEYTSKDDHGTSHISVLAANGDAVSITSTINNLYVENKYQS